MLQKKTRIRKAITKYDIIVVDEVQDMNILYFHVLCQLITDSHNQNVQLCILGDKYQSIFDFNGADNRFITNGENIFTMNVRDWQKVSLPVSFRITEGMSLFINNCMLYNNRILSAKSTMLEKPLYIICNTFVKKNIVYDLLVQYLNNGVDPDEIFILAPSLKKSKNDSPIIILENELKNTKINGNSIPIYVSTGNVKLDNDIIKNKLVFSTFHQCKGLERKIVIVYGFDISYPLYYNKFHDSYICPNTLYVACTRASEKLILVHHVKNDYLPFLNQKTLPLYCEILGEIEDTNIKNNKENWDYTVTNFIDHLSVDTIDECLQNITIIPIQPIATKIDIATKTIQKDTLYEEVSEITGTAIPLYYQYLVHPMDNIITGTINKCSLITSTINDNIIINTHRKQISEYTISNITIPQLLHVILYYNSETNYIYKLDQIINYNWLSMENMELGLERLRTILLPSSHKIFEYKVELEVTSTVTLSGRIDCIDDENVYEFKCVTELQHEHYIQLVIYKYLYETLHPESKKRYYLYNILTNELNEVVCSNESIYKIILCIISCKRDKPIKKSDDEFYNEIKIIRDKGKGTEKNQN
jgi:hypothetical protein